MGARNFPRLLGYAKHPLSVVHAFADARFRRRTLAQTHAFADARFCRHTLSQTGDNPASQLCKEPTSGVTLPRSWLYY